MSTNLTGVSSSLPERPGSSKTTHNHRGVKNPRARLTPDQVLAIHSSDQTEAVLSARYGVTKAAIGLIRRGERWAHITQAEDASLDGAA